jgi:glycine/D-amino acid oxidase-like deaminating enzyme
MNIPSESLDALVIGGGFFGGAIAIHLRRFFPRVLLVEQSSQLLGRASYNNQARVHQGYHYPRSLLTALRSRVNFARFTADYRECVDGSFTKLYAVSRRFSNVTAAQFRAFCERIGAPIAPAPRHLRSLFDRDAVEDAFLVDEWAFDASKLKQRITRDLAVAGVDVRLGTRAVQVRPGPRGGIDVEIAGAERMQPPEHVRARWVFNCTYSGLNHLLARSGLPLIPLKHEMTELALVEPPHELQGVGVTVMCGPFFSVMPFPARGLHSLSHVRYTPHFSWEERAEVRAPPRWHGQSPVPTAFDRMVRDAERYLPCLRNSQYRESLWEVKTVLPASEADDSRPILFRVHHGLPNLVCLMGGKIDNVYDVLNELDQLERARRLA